MTEQKTQEFHTCTALFLFLILMIHNVSNTFICCLQNLAAIHFCCLLNLVETVMVPEEEQGVLKKMVLFKLKQIWFCTSHGTMDSFFAVTSLTSEICSLSSIFLLVMKECHHSIEGCCTIGTKILFY